MEILIPHATALALRARGWAALTPDGELLEGVLDDTSALPANAPLLVCHLPYIATRMSLPVPALDVLELFAFVRPACFCVPTVAGLAMALDHPAPTDAESAAMLLPDLARELLSELAQTPEKHRDALANLAEAMGGQGQGWGWTQSVMAALGRQYDPNKTPRVREALSVWTTLPEWADEAPPPPPSAQPVTGDAVRAHLDDLVIRRRGAGRAGEGRTAQQNYATRVIDAFAPRSGENEPNVVTAEAGTGVGKTLGYLAPAQLWADTNEGTVWISTYTRNLQRQIDSELEILYPEPTERARKSVIRKGRENYLCLLNFEDHAGIAQNARDPRTIVAAGLMARWISATRDGDMSGNGFSGWLPGLLGPEHTLALADRRGECTFAACPHYRRCFIEHTQRRAARARLVIANHALVMAKLDLADDGDTIATRFVFDEGHHLFDAADSTFSAHLTALESADFRRWILGPEDESASRRARRARGLRKRLEGLVDENNAAYKLLVEALHAARALPAPNWRKTLNAGEPQGPIETLLHAIRLQVRARASDPHTGWSIECDTGPLEPDVAAAIPAATAALRALHRPLLAMAVELRKKLEAEYDDLSADLRARLDATARGLERRATNVIAAWIAMLENLTTPKPAAFVDWFEITRMDGRDYDVGFFRHYLDPATPFANELRTWAHGVLVTSATLKTSRNDDEAAWVETDRMTGTGAMASVAPARVAIPSPFDYAANTRVLVVRDVSKTDMALLARAYEGLFAAAGGGALGLFTAIHRLRAVHKHLAPALESRSLPVYAQHVDSIDIGTLVDMFRAEEDACLLGTDAVRDGVDVPGRSLRLIAFDRVPWPRPTILHRERRKAMGGKDYDESLTRMKLRQAYGRLVRTHADRGVFVMLDSAFPTRLEDAFPQGVKVERVSLDEAVDIVKNTV